MKTWIVFIGFFAFAGSVHAQITKCVDATGRTVYSQGPCPKGAKSSTVTTAAPTAPPAAASGKSGEPGKASGPKSTAELEQDFRKRQQEQADSRKKEDERLAQAKVEQENCTAARQQLAGIEIGGRQSSINEKGERFFLDDAQIEQRRQRAQQAVQSFCK